MGFRHFAEELAEQPALACETLFVSGCLYGNVAALQAVLRRVERELETNSMVVFNGDFHWLDVDARDFQAISESVLTHRATQGNVEASLVLGHRDCGCAYPDYVDDTTVAHSNAVAARLRHTASQFPDLLEQISLLPHHLTVAVAGERVGIVHGDPTSLAGWRLALEAMEPPDPVVRPTSFSGPPTDGSVVADWLRRANVSVLCCTHTGLPFAQDFTVEGHRYLVINNGSVGLPCFSEPRCGVMTRLSGQPDPPPDSLYGTRIGRLRCDALPVQADWTARFLEQWPAGSPGHDAYLHRLRHGTPLRLEQAARGTVDDPTISSASHGPLNTAGLS